jgi:TolA-binding protein
MSRHKHLLTKHELKEDIIMTYIYKAIDFLFKYKEKFLIGLVSISAIILIFISLNYQKKSLEAEAFKALTSAKELYEKGDIVEAEQEFQKIIKKYINIDTGIQAMFFIANSYYNKKEYDKCLDITSSALKKVKKNNILYPKLLMFQGYCYEQKNKYDFAIKRYKEFTDNYPEHYLYPEIGLALARCYKLEGNIESSNTTYKTIIQKYPTTEWEKQALNLIKK